MSLRIHAKGDGTGAGDDDDTRLAFSGANQRGDGVVGHLQQARRHDIANDWGFVFGAAGHAEKGALELGQALAHAEGRVAPGRADRDQDRFPQLLCAAGAGHVV